MMPELEATTRKKRINTKLESSLLQWKIIPYTDTLDISILDAHAVTEFPTTTGQADYALFVNGLLLGIIEAKKIWGT